MQPLVVSKLVVDQFLPALSLKASQAWIITTRSLFWTVLLSLSLHMVAGGAAKQLLPVPSSSSHDLVASLTFEGRWGSGIQQEPQLHAIRDGPTYAKNRTAGWSKGCSPLGRPAVINASVVGSPRHLSDLVLFVFVVHTVVHRFPNRRKFGWFALEAAGGCVRR